MESRYGSVSLKVCQLVDHVGKSRTDLNTETPVVEDKDVSQSADFKSNSSFNKLGKRKRSCELSHRSYFVTSPLKNYENFMRSGLVSRLLYHQDGEWIDFPREVMELVRKKFQMKHALVEVEMYDSRFILDVMYMRKLDINTGTEKAIAWIDDVGTCFFPEVCEDSGVHHLDSNEKSIAHDINLHLQIEFNGGHDDGVDENAVELRAFKKIRVRKSLSDKGSNDDTQTDDGRLGVGYGVNDVSFSTLDSSGPEVSRCSSIDYHCRHNDVDITKVYEMFRAGMGDLSCPTVIEIRGCSSKHMVNRLELFDTLVKQTEKLRGSSNLQYAWLASARKDVSSIMSYGLGLGGLPSVSAYGYGVHLSSKNHAYTSVKNCDDDENGVRHMLLCRVVLGNVEPVDLGSDQFCPSSDQFDTGVDNILDPRVHIVWEVNALTHIYPEYVVSFKLTSRPEVGAFVAQMGSSEASKVATAQVDPLLQFVPSNASELNYHPGKDHKKESLGRTTALGPSFPETPNSPWMPFPVLFNALSKKVPPKTMHLVYHHYYMFKCKKIISRSEFVRRMRMIVGDALLKSTITSLQSELRPPNLNVRKPDQKPAA